MSNPPDWDDVSLPELFGWYGLGEIFPDVTSPPSALVVARTEPVGSAGRHRRGGHSVSMHGRARGHHVSAR